MSRLFLGIFFLFSFAFTNLYAHQYSIYPVQIDLKVEKEKIRVSIENQSDFWVGEILGLPLPPPPTHWPEEYQRRSQEEIQKSFALFLNDHLLSPTSFSCRYIEEPLRLTDSKVRFEVEYPLPTPSGVLRGRVLFFHETYKEFLVEKEKNEIHEEFGSRLLLSGKKSRIVDLPMDNPDFQFPIEDLKRTPAQYAQESFLTAFAFFFDHLLLVFFSMGVLLFYFIFSDRWVVQIGYWTGTLCLVGLSFLSSSDFYLRLFPAYQWLLLVFFISFVALKIPYAKVGFGILVFFSIFSWPLFLFQDLSRLPFSLVSSWTVKPAYLLGSLAAGTLVIFLIQLAFALYKKRLKRLYESVADKMMASHRRTLAGFILFISSVQFIRLILGGK